MVALLLAGLTSAAAAQPKRNASRAGLLYTTHCIACHDSEIHWRDKKTAKDWASLKAEVARWQRIAGLGWRDDDITGVVRHLNTLGWIPGAMLLRHTDGAFAYFGGKLVWS